jgi:DNA-directed RNA polymerase
MTLLTQQEVEERMYHGGIIRAENGMARAEEQGRAHQNPYAKELFREYVLPLAGAMAADVKSKKAGRRQAHVVLLDSLDLEAVAFLSVRYVMSVLLSAKPEAHRQLAYGIGRTVHRELVLAQIQDKAPELYQTLALDFGRKMSKNERHRMTVFMMQAKQAGIDIVEWSVGSREQVGLYILGLLEDAGMVELGAEVRTGYKRDAREVFLHPEIVERIDKVKAYVAVTMPTYGPCVEPPLDWGFGVTGGFHYPGLRRANSTLVHARATARALGRNTDMPVVFAAVNALQRTAWQVNRRVLETVYAVAAEFSTKEIVSLSDCPAPDKPTWLREDWTKAPKTEWPEAKQAEFKQWKRDTAEWHTQRKLLGSRYARFYAATRAADMFKDQPAIYFVYFADSRGRLYPLTYGLNPQGSDLSKALLRFSEGLPLTNPDAVKWFHVQGANKWGFDKATLQERVDWVNQRQDLIMSFAEDPVNNTGWTEAGDPLQFLAWCFEYEDYVTNPQGFVSHLPISMDGSCNGLQNLSAMFRDEIGGAATNLTNNAVMRDIYSDVAKAADERLRKHKPADEAEQRLITMWLAHGISRKAVKRSVMTTPYGVTERTATEYIIDDYLREGLGPTFDKTEYRRAAKLLMSVVWPAIGDVVVKGREAMDWLRKCARVIMKNLPEGEDTISWRTPSGFPACQDYFEAEVHRINTWLHGPLKIRVLTETAEPDVTRHDSGMAPNFVHSLDAAHLHLTTADAASQGITALAMIHDDYGTHAANAQALFESIRKQFVAMYLACDPPADLAAKYPCVPPPPSKGALDIMEVLESDFFFS